MKNLNAKEINETIKNIMITNKEKSLMMLKDIQDHLPREFSELIEQSFIHKRIPKEYFLSSILFAVSTSIGLTFYIEALGYINYANLYFINAGSRGDTKSEAMKIATKPLKDLDNKGYEEYKQEYKLNKKNSDLEDGDEPERQQILIQNATIEAVHKIHSENPNSIGIFLDEIYSLVEKMGNSSSRDGVPWRTFLLEGYNNGHVDVARKTTGSIRINETYPTLLGSIQYQFVPNLFSKGNLESGFIDRLLFTPRLTKNNNLSKGKISPKAINDYNSSILNIIAYKRQSEREDEPVKQFQIKLSDEAQDILFDYVQELIERQNSAEPIIKEYMAKMQISIHKFCLLVHMMNNCRNSNFISVLDLQTVELAIKFNEFYFINFKIILEEGLSNPKKEPTLGEIIKLAKKNKAQQKDVVAITGLHKGTVSREWNKGSCNPQPATLKLV